MSLVLWIIVGVLAGIIVLALLMMMYFRRKPVKRRETEYYAFFVIGICMIPTGIVFMTAVLVPLGFVFLVLGICYMAIGLANRDKWEKNKRRVKK